MISILLMQITGDSKDFIERNIASLTILVITGMGFLTLLLLVPRLLRARQQKLELQHAERMKALDLGQVLPHPDENSIAAGRTASLVPMVVICATAAVTCFLAVYRPDNFFGVGLAAWSVSGAVSLAAITGGVALMGRLAQLHSGIGDEEDEEADEIGEATR
jgi:hypothetical protein